MPRGEPFARIPLRLEADDLAEAERLADAEGTDRSAILRRWITRGRQVEESPPARPRSDPHRPTPQPARRATPAHAAPHIPGSVKTYSKSEQVGRRDR